MNSTSVIADSVQLVGILGLEVALVFVAIALLARRAPSASWRRVMWQAGLVAVLGLTACELSGVGGWATTHLTWQQKDLANRAQPAEPPGPQLDSEFRARVEARLASRRAIESSLPVANSPGRLKENVGHLSNLNYQIAASVPDLSRVGTGGSKVQPYLAAADEDSEPLLFLWFSWSAVTLLLAGRAFLSRCLLFLFRFRRRQVTDTALQARVRKLSRELGIGARVRLVESNRLRSPIAFGLVHPTIALPRDFAVRFTPERQEAMLAHELAHLAGHDPAWSLIADLCLALLWWHPAVWWMRREFRLASELAADEASLVLEDGPAVLAECLLEMGARLAGHRELGQVRVSGFRSHLGRRIQRLVRLEARAWSPLPRVRAALLLFVMPLFLAALVVVCTAWAAPQAQTKGNAMQSMQLSLKRSLATLALLAAANTSAPAGAAENATPAPVQPTPSSAVAPAAAPSPRTQKEQQDAFRRRYGIAGPPADVMAASPKRQKIESKLNEIVIPEVHFDGLPLSEVMKILSDYAVKLDPEKKGLNFLINNNNPPVAPGAFVDPTTGLPAVPPVEAVDVTVVMVKFSLPLRNVSLKDTLEAVVKVAERPLEYSVEDYGVVVSLKPDATPGQRYAAASTPAQPSEPLVAATFKVDTNTFLAGLENAFGIKVSRAEPAAAKDRARDIQTALKALLAQLGIGGGDSRSIFYNDLTGIIMVRTTASEQGIVQAAIETLGGTAVSSYNVAVGGVGGYGVIGGGLGGGGR